MFAAARSAGPLTDLDRACRHAALRGPRDQAGLGPDLARTFEHALTYDRDTIAVPVARR